MQADKRGADAGLLIKLAPHFFEFSGKAPDETGIIGDDDVFVVLGCCRPCPIVAAGEEEVIVRNGKFVVHVGGGPIQAAIDSGLGEVCQIRAQVHRFIVIGDDADPDSTGKGFFQSAHDPVVSDCKNADVQRLAAFSNEPADSVKAIFPRAEKRGSFDLVFTCVEEFDHSLEPVEGGDLPELIDGSLRQFKGELPGLGLLGCVSCNFRKVDFEFLSFGPAEREVFERLLHEIFQL